MTLLFTDPRFLLHDTGRHVETPARLGAITKRLEESGLAKRCTKQTWKPIGEDEILAVHDAALVALLKSITAQGGGWADGDTVVSEKSLEAAKLAAGAATAAVNAVLAGQAKNALCLIRPPGHHATPDRSMGFCLINNIALAAHHALAKHQLNRILIVDWDVHHGNGTQDIFYADPRVQFLSIHRYGHGFYPGTGAADETGTGKGLGYTCNVPLPETTRRPEYFDAFAQALEQSASRIRPELVLISAGFDAHRLDPIGRLGLEVEDFAELTKRVLEMANVHCQGRVVSCLEGGYNIHVLAECVQAHLEMLLGPPTGLLVR
ncbi:MAG TPA: histone deacetylase [Gemmataceae bacterium]|jgi:acetoin utilization deacetylase AcuC-like enzyme|nr:histone deacetylase [Gemmataceae bacterium]